MPTTHICLISDQPIPNLLPLLLEKPDKAVFLVSPEMTAQAERLKKVLQPARRLRDEDRERAKKMKIELVDGQEALKLGERLKMWLA